MLLLSTVHCIIVSKQGRNKMNTITTLIALIIYVALLGITAIALIGMLSQLAFPILVVLGLVIFSNK